MDPCEKLKLKYQHPIPMLADILLRHPEWNFLFSFLLSLSVRVRFLCNRSLLAAQC